MQYTHWALGGVGRRLELPEPDLLGEAVLHGRLGLVDQREPSRTDFREMFRDDVGDGVLLRRPLQIGFCVFQ